MSDYADFLKEKLKIDRLLERGYTIARAKSTLDGDIFEFENPAAVPKVESLLLRVADSRKYVTTLYLKEQKKTS